MKSSLKLTLVLVGVVSGVLSGFLLWIQSDSGVQWIERQIDQEIPGQISIGRLKLSLSGVGVELGEIVIRDEEGAALAGFEGLRVSLDLLGLSGNEVFLDRVTLEKPWADLRTDENGALNLAGALSASDTSDEKQADMLPLGLFFKSIRIVDGRLSYGREGHDPDLVVVGIDVQASGRLLERSGRGSLRIGQFEWSSDNFKLPPSTVELQAELQENEVRISSGSIRSDRLSLDLKGAVTGLDDRPLLSGNLALETGMDVLKEMLGLSGDYGGELVSRMTISGSPDNPDLSGELSLKDGRVNDSLLDSGKLTVSLHDRRAEIGGTCQSSLNSMTLHSLVDMRQSFPKGFFQEPAEPDKLSYTLTLSPSIQDPESLGFQSDQIDGRFAGVLNISGTGVNPESMTVEMAAEGTVGQVIAPSLKEPLDVDFDLSCRLDRGKVFVDGVRLASKAGRIEGRATFGLLPDFRGIDPDFNNMFALQMLELSPDVFGAASSFGGLFGGNLQLHGTLSELSGEMALSGTKLQIGEMVLGDLQSALRLDQGRILVDRMELVKQSSRLGALGYIQVFSPGTLQPQQDPVLDFKIDSSHLDPADFTEQAGGSFTLSGRVFGSVDKPVASLDLAGEEVDFAGQAFAGLNLKARYEERKVLLDRLEAAVDRLHVIGGEGWLDLDENFELLIGGEDIPVSAISALKDRIPGDGNMQFEILGRGKLDNPELDGYLNLSEIMINEESVENGYLVFNLHDMKASVQGTLNFDFDGVCDLKSGRFELESHFDKSRMGTFFRIAGMPEYGGMLTGMVQATGNYHEPSGIAGLVDLTAIEMKYRDVALISGDRFHLELSDRRLSVPETALTVLGSGTIQLKGSSSLDGKMNVDLSGSLPVSSAGSFVERLAEAKGKLVLRGKVTGEIEEPVIEGVVDLEGVAMEIPDYFQKLHEVNGRILLGPEFIRIDGLSGRLDTGSFRVEGELEHEQFRPSGLDVRIAMKSLPVEVPDSFSALLDGDVRLVGDGRVMDASGKIVMQEGEYHKDVEVNLLKLATSQRRAIAPESEPASLPFFETINLDLVIEDRRPFLVRNNLAQLEIDPDLKVQGTLASPLIVGRAQVRSGIITFQKKNFEVKKGVVDYVNPYRTVAEIDIEGETTIRTWKIRIAIKGTPDSLDLRLSSTPVENDSDIISLILFGKTTREVAARTGTGQVNTNQILTGMLIDTFGEDVKETTGVDILEMETSGSGGQSETGAMKVTVGKHLSDRMTVKYAVESKDGEMIQRAISEYQLLENILVSGFQDNKGVYGSELVFRIEFR